MVLFKRMWYNVCTDHKYKVFALCTIQRRRKLKITIKVSAQLVHLYWYQNSTYRYFSISHKTHIFLSFQNYTYLFLGQWGIFRNIRAVDGDARKLREDLKKKAPDLTFWSIKRGYISAADGKIKRKSWKQNNI